VCSGASVEQIAGCVGVGGVYQVAGVGGRCSTEYRWANYAAVKAKDVSKCTLYTKATLLNNPAFNFSSSALNEALIDC
jgi:hypothetical protein